MTENRFYYYMYDNGHECLRDLNTSDEYDMTDLEDLLNQLYITLKEQHELINIMEIKSFAYEDEIKELHQKLFEERTKNALYRVKHDGESFESVDDFLKRLREW